MSPLAPYSAELARLSLANLQLALELDQARRERDQAKTDLGISQAVSRALGEELENAQAAIRYQVLTRAGKHAGNQQRGPRHGNRR